MTQKHYATIADLYDQFVTGDFDFEFFIKEAQSVSGKVLELMSGTGRLSLPMIEAGIPLVCVDYSDHMLEILQRKLSENQLNAEVHQADIRVMDLGRQFEQIIIPFHAFPEITNRDDQLAVLHRIYEHLSDKGTFICTLHNPPVRKQSVDGHYRLARKLKSDNGHLMVWLLQRFTENPGIVEVLEFFELYDENGKMISKRFSELTFNLLEKPDFERLVSEAGFKVEALYGNYAYADFDEATSPVMIWKLKK